MKYIVLLGDGMADYPVQELGNKTPLQTAYKPNMDRLARQGENGMVKTVPDSLSPGSDVANLAVMGYDPQKYYSGRSPLEAASMGIYLSDTDVTFRCNLVTLSEAENYEDRIMLDHSSDEITTEEASRLIEAANKYFQNDYLTFYTGVSYRHCLLWRNCPQNNLANGNSPKDSYTNNHCSLDFDLTPPHDILDRCIKDYLPKGENSKIILDMMKKSTEFLTSHPVNKNRISRGLKPANSLWLWGEGKKPAIPSFYERYGLKGSVISAVDLIKGLGICAGFNSVDIEGATGTLNTNYKGKALAALEELKNGSDFVYIHVEAPDECGHRQEIENKVKSIELIDELVLSTLLDGLNGLGEYKILLLPDHPTPLSLRTHTKDPVPYVIYQSNKIIESPVNGYNESEALKSGSLIEDGYTLMDYFVSHK